MIRTKFRELERLVAEAPLVVHSTHVNPDADGLGSALALSRWLRRSGKPCRVVVPSPVSHRLAFLGKPNEVEVHVPTAPPFPDGSLLVIYDVSTLQRLGSLRPIAEAWPGPRVVFDHHDGEVDFHGLAIVDPDAGATAQLVFDALEAWGAPLDEDIAVPLYVGLIADTGSFNYGKTTPRTHEIAARLLQSGVDPLAIHGLLEGSSSLAAVRVAGSVMAGIVLDGQDARIAHATLPHALWLEGGAESLDTVALVNQTISIEGVLAGFMLIEVARNATRLSLRSKNGVDILGVARSFGGGGHGNAAGATIAASLDAARTEVLARLRRDLAEQLGPAR